MKWYRDFILQVTEDLYGFFAFLTVPGPPFPEPLHGKKMCGIVWCYQGPLDEAEDVFRPIRAVRPPAFEHVGPIPFPALQSVNQNIVPVG